jgi:hypothetical protein
MCAAHAAHVRRTCGAMCQKARKKQWLLHFSAVAN